MLPGDSTVDGQNEHLNELTYPYGSGIANTYGEVNPMLTSNSPGYRENNKQRDINTSFLTTPLEIDFTRTLVDQQDCKTRDYSRPSIEPQFDATKTLACVGADGWSVIVRAKQDSRGVLKTVANSYLDLWSSNGNFELPWGTPCSRLEALVYYTEECQPMSLNGETDTDKRYVTDEGLGAVSVLTKGGSDGTLLGIHEFSFVQGKLRYVHHYTASDAVSVV
ncbi:hypothetical protein GE21DRAFT_1273621 [Neurospora crassa]|nr:hypothetical protein GE21DRAFT_1273621 [Neurospora crassa]